MESTRRNKRPCSALAESDESCARRAFNSHRPSSQRQRTNKRARRCTKQTTLVSVDCFSHSLLSFCAVVCCVFFSKTGLDIMSGSASAPPLSELPEGERVRHRVAYIEARTPLADIHEHPPSSSSASPSISARPSWGQVGSEGEQYLPADDVHQQQEGLLNNAFAAASKVAEARQRT